MSDPGRNPIVAAVASSKKYRALCPDTILRFAAQEEDRHRSTKAAIKATKRRLHQVYGAFEMDIDFDGAIQRLEQAYVCGSETEFQDTCRQVLALHSSTRERLPILSEFYRRIFAITGQPHSVLDLGCGLNPLASPWMGLRTGTRYIALDIDCARIAFLNRFLTLSGREPLARCQDILVTQPGDTLASLGADAVDIAFLLKMSPTLERQEPGVTPRLIGEIEARFVVVSFAVKSLGGRDKGMRDQYRRQFLEWALERHWSIEELAFDRELVYVVHRAGNG